MTLIQCLIVNTAFLLSGAAAVDVTYLKFPSYGTDCPYTPQRISQIDLQLAAWAPMSHGFNIGNWISSLKLCGAPVKDVNIVYYEYLEHVEQFIYHYTKTADNVSYSL